MKMKCIIVEDEPHSMSRMKKLISNFENLELIGEAVDGEEAIQVIEKLEPDLLFLDINIPIKNGFEVLKEITYKPLVIFVTAYDNYAVKAFEENAIDYILKPTTVDRLKISVEKAFKKNIKIDDNLLDTIQKYMKGENGVKRYSIKDKDDIIVIPQEEIYYFKAQEKYTFLCTNDKEYFYDSSLKKIEEQMDSNYFIRIHKSYIVSIEKIKKLQKIFMREYIVELSDKQKTILKVGRNYLSGLKEKLNF